MKRALDICHEIGGLFNGEDCSQLFNLPGYGMKQCVLFEIEWL